MIFQSPGWLWMFAAIALLIAGYIVVQLLRRRYAARFTNLRLLDRVAPRRPGWRRHVGAACFLAMLSLLVIGAARPAAEVQVPRDRATIIVAVDVSISMEATDVPPNRLEAAKDAAKRFIDGLPDRFNVGLVAFARTAVVVSSPTIDHRQVMTAVDGLQLRTGTAIGEAVHSSLDAIRTFDQQAATDPPPAAIVLLSDGDNTVGRPVPEAIAAAKEAKVPVSTIAYGTQAGEIIYEGKRIGVPVNKRTLESLAAGTGGKAYEAESGSELDEVYKQIGTSLGYKIVHQEITQRFVIFGLLAGLIAAAVFLLLGSRFP